MIKSKKLTISIRIFPDENKEYTFSDSPDITWNIIQHNKGDAIYPNSKFIAERNTIIFKKVAVFETFNEGKLLSILKRIFEYIENKKISGSKEVYFSYIIENEQFGFGLSSHFIQLLAQYGYGISLSGVYFYD
ncbi:MAG: hypothetical protein P1P64_00420 [Treponemataceae bacterium]